MFRKDLQINVTARDGFVGFLGHALYIYHSSFNRIFKIFILKRTHNIIYIYIYRVLIIMPADTLYAFTIIYFFIR